MAAPFVPATTPAMRTRAVASPSVTSPGVSPAVPRRRAARAAAGRSPGEGRAPFARARRPSRSVGFARVDRDGTDDASGSGSAERVARALAAFAAASTLALAPASAPALAANPAYSGVDPEASDLIKRLRARSDANKAEYNEQRLDNFYRRDYAINKLVGKEVLPEPCDPRDPEFGYRCGSKLPRLPMSRTDPFDDRSKPDAPRRGAVFGLNDLNVEDEPGFGVTESNTFEGTTEGTESDIDDVDDETSLESSGVTSVEARADENE